MVDGAHQAERLGVFISYSRRDALEFADQLAKALELLGYRSIIDREGISGGEEWKIRLGELILECDTVVFVMTPESAVSPVCAWEVEEAARLSKRILPVIAMPLGGKAVPERLQRLNFIHFYPEPSVPGSGFGHGLVKLDSALKSDLSWLRQHRDVLVRAEAWEVANRDPDRLLRGRPLAEAELWRASRPLTAPSITDTQRAYLEASRDAEDKSTAVLRHQLEERERLLAESEAAQKKAVEAQAAREAAQTAERAARKRRRQVELALMSVIALIACTGIMYAAWSNREFIAAEIKTLAEDLRPRGLTTEAEARLKSGDSFQECESCPGMIVLPEGWFMMGADPREPGAYPNQRPSHKVTIAYPFAVSKYEVTFAEWDACAAVRACSRSPDDVRWGRGQRPVINVSWQDAQQFVSWLSKRTGKLYRLLTEAEWEYAARAGSPAHYSWGDDMGRGNANCNDCGSRWDNKQTAPVGSFDANPFGLYDMYGNVWEWVQDCYKPNYDETPLDGSPVTIENCGIHIVRGGSWNNAPVDLRASVRMSMGSDYRISVGFRVARAIVREDAHVPDFVMPTHTDLSTRTGAGARKLPKTPESRTLTRAVCTENLNPHVLVMKSAED